MWSEQPVLAEISLLTGWSANIFASPHRVEGQRGVQSLEGCSITLFTTNNELFWMIACGDIVKCPEHVIPNHTIVLMRQAMVSRCWHIHCFEVEPVVCLDSATASRSDGRLYLGTGMLNGSIP